MSISFTLQDFKLYMLGPQYPQGPQQIQINARNNSHVAVFPIEWFSLFKIFLWHLLFSCDSTTPHKSVSAYDAKNISRAFKWPNFAEGFVLEALSRLERQSYRFQICTNRFEFQIYFQKWGYKLNLHKECSIYRKKKIPELWFVNQIYSRKSLSLHRILKNEKTKNIRCK